MILKTFGHATLCFYEKENFPIVITDPWLYGSCYWRSWWLQNYPTESEISFLKKTKNILFTHEHWDHMHVPSLKKIFNGQTILLPNLNSKKLKNFIDSSFQGSIELDSFNWQQLHENLKIFSIPLYNDDSIVIFETSKFIIINFNDAKPTPSILNAIDNYRNKINKKMILLQSYAPASIVNSFRNNKLEVVSIKEKHDYINYIKSICSRLSADYFVPFASQAIYSRPDTSWANNYKVSFEDLKNSWNEKTILCKPYVRFDLQNESHNSYIEKYNFSKKMNKISKEIQKKSNETEIELEKLNTFSKLTKPVKLFLILLFPFGLVFKFNNLLFKYNFFLGKFKNLNKYVKKYFYFEIPAYEFIESINNGHFTDTGTSFILKISVKKRFDIYRSYLLFIFLTYSEKGYFSNYKLFFKQILLIFKNLMPFKISFR